MHGQMGENKNDTKNQKVWNKNENGMIDINGIFAAIIMVIVIIARSAEGQGNPVALAPGGIEPSHRW
jgi:hypothetical protein